MSGIGLTLPVTSVSNKRSFSILCRLKTWDRSTMTEERLSALAMMYVNRDLIPSFEEFITVFTQKQNFYLIKTS